MPATPEDEPFSQLAILHDPPHYMHEIALGLHDTIFTHTDEITARKEDNTIQGDMTFGPMGVNHSALLLSDMVVMDIPGGNIILLNNTVHNYTMIVMIWDSPADIPATPSSTHFRRIVSQLDDWQLYMSHLVVFVLTYKVGRFIYDRFQNRRGRGDGLQNE